MKITATFLSCIAALSAFAAAGPVAADPPGWNAAKEPFLKRCHGAMVAWKDNRWTLFAQCAAGGDKFWSELDLNKCLVNRNSLVKWDCDGRFSSTCYACEITEESKLWCQCKKKNNSAYHPSEPHVNLNDNVEFNPFTRRLHCDGLAP